MKAVMETVTVLSRPSRTGDGSLSYFGERCDNMIGDLVLIFTIASMLSSATFGFLTLTRMKSTKREYIVMGTFCIVLVELGYLLEMMATTTDGGLTAMRIMYFAGGLIAPLFFMFAQEYCEIKLPKIVNILVFISAIIVVLLMWTTDRHLLFYAAFWYDDVSQVNNLAVVRGPLYQFGIYQPAVTVALTVGVIIKKMRETKGEKHINLYLMIYGALTPILPSFLHLTNINIQGANYTPIFLGITTIILYWGVFRHDLLENEETIRSQNWLKDMIGNISHDLKTPLSVMSVNLEALSELAETKSDADYQRYVRVAYQKNLDLQRLTNNLFQVTRIETGHGKYSPQWISLLTLLVNVNDKNNDYLEDKGIVFDVTVGMDIEISTDPQFVYSVFDNIIYNAVRHTESGDSITITTENKESTAIVTITDTGCGVDPELLPHVFDRFFKGDPARGGKGGDSGLGLFIVKSVMEGCGGSASAQSEPGKGMSVILTFPARYHQ